MRVDAALEAEQKSDAYDPVATLHWHDGANWIDLNPSDQLREGIRIDAPYSTQAQIKLDNSDAAYDALDVKRKLGETDREILETMSRNLATLTQKVLDSCEGYCQNPVVVLG